MYNDLITAYKESRTQENLAALAEWFEHNGNVSWNGECYYCKELNISIYPVYKPTDFDEETGEAVQWDIIGWEAR